MQQMQPNCPSHKRPLPQECKDTAKENEPLKKKPRRIKLTIKANKNQQANTSQQNNNNIELASTLAQDENFIKQHRSNCPQSIHEEITTNTNSQTNNITSINNATATQINGTASQSNIRSSSESIFPTSPASSSTTSSESGSSSSSNSSSGSSSSSTSNSSSSSNQSTANETNNHSQTDSSNTETAQNPLSDQDTTSQDDTSDQSDSSVIDETAKRNFYTNFDYGIIAPSKSYADLLAASIEPYLNKENLLQVKCICGGDLQRMNVTTAIYKTKPECDRCQKPIACGSVAYTCTQQNENAYMWHGRYENKEQSLGYDLCSTCFSFMVQDYFPYFQREIDDETLRKSLL